MKLAWTFGIVSAVLLHAGILLFGGIFFMDKEDDAGSVQPVDLLSDLEAEQKKDEEPEKTETEPAEEMEPEAPPNGAEILRSLDMPSVDDAPALEAASLSAIEAALSGVGGGGDFSEALSFSSGGRIGGTGTGDWADKSMEEAFSLAELDQKPRAIHQGSPVFPSEMRGKKLEGLVTVIFFVDASGKVDNPRVERSSHPAFESPALSAVKKWKFEPGMRGGQRVASKMRVSIRFPES